MGIHHIETLASQESFEYLSILWQSSIQISLLQPRFIKRTHGFHTMWNSWSTISEIVLLAVQTELIDFVLFEQTLGELTFEVWVGSNYIEMPLSTLLLAFDFHSISRRIVWSMASKNRFISSVPSGLICLNILKLYV